MRRTTVAPVRLFASVLVAALLAVAARAASAATAGLPGDSVYQLPMQLTDQRGRARELRSLRGRAVLVTMFYTTCKNVCPMLAFQMHRIEKALPAAAREHLQVLMVSFDPERDTTPALAHFAELHRADPARWVIARADAADVRNLAAVLGVRYRRLDGGIYSHSSVISLLDADGVIRARSSELQHVDPDFLAAVSAAAQ